MARARQMDDFMVGGRRGPSARNRPDPNAGRRPGDPYIIAQDSRPVGTEGLSQNEIRQFEDFLNVSGRGDKIRNRTNISGRDAAKLARMQFDQFRNLQRGGDYAPSLTPGMRVPGGTIQRVPQEGGLAGFLGRGGFLGNFLADISGNAPKTIQASGGSGRRGRGSFNLNTGQTSAARKPTLSDDQIFDSLIKRATTVADANIPTGGIMDNVAAPVDAPVSITTQPSGAISGQVSEIGMDTPFLGPISENMPVEPPVSTAEQPVSTVDTMTDFDRALSDAIALQTAARDAADATELAEINMLMRGRELADRDARNQALQQSIGQAVADAQIRDAERAAALDAVNQAALEETRRQAALEALFTEAGLENMVGDGPMLELPPGTDPIDDFDMLTLGTTPVPPAESPYTPELEEIFTERDLGNMSFNESVDRDVIEPAVALMSSRLIPGSAPLPLPTGGVDFDTMPFFESSFLVDRPMDRFVDPDAVNARARLNQNARRAGVGMGGRGRITSRVPLRVSPSYFGDLS